MATRDADTLACMVESNALFHQLYYQLRDIADFLGECQCMYSVYCTVCIVLCMFLVLLLFFSFLFELAPLMI